MPETFYSILTNKGIEKYTAADAGGPIVSLAEFAVGDSGGAYFEPLPTQVSLVNELWRGAVNSVYVHPNNTNWLVIEVLIPAADGGFDIREAGVFDAAGDLIAVAKYPLTTKPAPGSGSEKDLYVRLIFERANAAEVTQQIDPSLVMATKEYVDTRDWRESVRVATTAPIADLAAGAPDTLDGVALAQGDRVLVKDQAAAAENGIYVVDTVGTGADGAWVRAADADNGLDISANFSVAVEEGAVNADSLWMLTTDHPITLGVTALTFKRLITQTELDAHAGRTDNPHGVTAAQTGADPAGTAAAAVAAHEGAGDPHPQYETDTEVQAKVDAAVALLIDSSPAALDTLNELAAALGDDPNFATTMTNALAGKAAVGHNHDGTYETPAGAQGKVDTHGNRTDNPHGVTKAQVGLGSVADYGIATPAEASLGAIGTKYMTPYRTVETIDSHTIGRGQTWQDVTASRVADVEYTNLTGQPIMVIVAHGNITGTTSGILYAGPLSSSIPLGDSRGQGAIPAIIPPGWHYKYSGSITTWVELR